MDSRSRIELIGWLSSHDYSHFATWTFGKKWPSPSRSVVERYVPRWCDEMRISRYFWVAERGSSGQLRWHGHGLIGGSPLLRPDVNPQALWENWSKRFGRCTFEPISDQLALSAYVAKYLTKGLPSVWGIQG